MYILFVLKREKAYVRFYSNVYFMSILKSEFYKVDIL